MKQPECQHAGKYRMCLKKDWGHLKKRVEEDTTKKSELGDREKPACLQSLTCLQTFRNMTRRRTTKISKRKRWLSSLCAQEDLGDNDFLQHDLSIHKSV